MKVIKVKKLQLCTIGPKNKTLHNLLMELCNNVFLLVNLGSFNIGSVRVSQ